MIEHGLPDIERVVVHHDISIIDLNSASEEVLANLPMIGRERAKALIEARPIMTWEDFEMIPGFDTGIVDDMKEGGAHLGHD